MGDTVRVKDLAEIQRQHLAWRLDHKTACGMITAGHIARLEPIWADWEVWRVFEWAGRSERSAKIHAKKVIEFEV
jgi:hypothetical protein